MGLVDGQLPIAFAALPDHFFFSFHVSLVRWQLVWYDKSLGYQQHPELNARRVTLILLASIGTSSS